MPKQLNLTKPLPVPQPSIVRVVRAEVLPEQKMCNFSWVGGSLDENGVFIYDDRNVQSVLIRDEDFNTLLIGTTILANLLAVLLNNVAGISEDTAGKVGDATIVTLNDVRVQETKAREV